MIVHEPVCERGGGPGPCGSVDGASSRAPRGCWLIPGVGRAVGSQPVNVRSHIGVSPSQRIYFFFFFKEGGRGVGFAVFI